MFGERLDDLSHNEDLACALDKDLVAQRLEGIHPEFIQFFSSFAFSNPLSIFSFPSVSDHPVSCALEGVRAELSRIGDQLNLKAKPRWWC